MMRAQLLTPTFYFSLRPALDASSSYIDPTLSNYLPTFPSHRNHPGIPCSQVLMPLMMAAYTLQYIDKSAMSYAAIFTFRAGESSCYLISTASPLPANVGQLS